MARIKRGSSSPVSPNSAEFPEEITVPAEPIGEAVPTAGRLLQRAQAARMLGVSKSTLRRMEGESLTPVIGPRNVRMFHEEEVRAVVVTRRAHLENSSERGEIAAEAFALFNSGADVVSTVTQLRVDPEMIEQLYARWVRLTGMLLLSAEARTEICNTLLGWDDGKLKTEADILAFLKKWIQNESTRPCTSCKKEWGCFCRTCAKQWGLEAAKRHLALQRSSKL